MGSNAASGGGSPLPKLLRAITEPVTKLIIQLLITLQAIVSMCLKEISKCKMVLVPHLRGQRSQASLISGTMLIPR